MLPELANVSRRSLKVWRRNFDVYLHTWMVNLLPPILEPVFYVLGFGLGLGSLIGGLAYQGHEVGYLAFMAPGVVGVAIMFWSYVETTYASFVRMYYQKTFDAMVATPLLVEDVIAGEILWGTTKSVMAAAIMLPILAGFGLVHWGTGLWVLPLALLGGLAFAGLGLVTTALTPNIESFNLPIFILVMPMFMFSGTFFPLDILPGWARAVAWCLPLTHVTLLVRGSTLGWFPDGWGWSLLYLVLLSAASFGAALVLMKRRLVEGRAFRRRAPRRREPAEAPGENPNGGDDR